MGTLQRAILKRSNARSCFEPRRSRDPAGGRFARKPTNGGRAYWRPPAGPRDATSNTRASASDPHSGHYMFADLSEPSSGGLMGVEQEAAVRAFLAELEGEQCDSGQVERAVSRM